MSENDWFERVDALVLAHRDGGLNEAQRSELEAMLRDHPEARLAFARAMHLDLMLRNESMTSVDDHTIAISPSEWRGSHQRHARWGWSAAVAALLCVAVMVGWLLRGAPSLEQAPIDTAAADSVPERMYQSVAVVSRLVGVDLSNDTLLSEGSPVSPGLLDVPSGLMVIDFYSGVRAVIQGPATIDISSPMAVNLIAGRFRFVVPHVATGFTAHSRHVDVIDIGTEFTIAIESTGDAEVHVIDGEVELKTPSGAPSKQLLSAGDARRCTVEGFTEIPSDVTGFISIEDLERKNSEYMQRRLEAWRAWEAERLLDPRLIAAFNFEDPEAEAPRQSSTTALTTAAIIGCQRVNGRWPGKTAVAYHLPGDRVRTKIPGTFDELTLAAWVRMDALENRQQGIVLADGFEVGNLHWQISSDGNLRLGVRLPDEPGRNNVFAIGYASPVIFSQQRLGVWTFVTTTYSRSRKQVSHYCNGRKVSSEDIRHDQPLWLGSCEIGNWGFPLNHSGAPVRNFNGVIDDVSLYNTALAGAEVVSLFRKGRP